MSHPIRGQGGYLVFLISPKNASLVEDVRILLPSSFVEFYSAVFRGKVENVSANHRPGRPFCFSDPPEKHQTWYRALRLVLYNRKIFIID